MASDNIKSSNGFTFAGGITADGTGVTLTALKDDHESRQQVVFNLSAETAHDLSELIRGFCTMAKSRRKAIRKASLPGSDREET